MTVMVNGVHLLNLVMKPIISTGSCVAVIKACVSSTDVCVISSPLSTDELRKQDVQSEG